MKRSFIHLFIFLLIAVALAACASPTPAAQTPVPQTGANVKEVKISNFAFDPASLTVPVGTTVKWTNQDSADHTVTADDKSFDSGKLGQGKDFSFTFSKEGTFSYKCTIHPNMVAKIIVTK